MRVSLRKPFLTLNYSALWGSESDFHRADVTKQSLSAFVATRDGAEPPLERKKHEDET